MERSRSLALIYSGMYAGSILGLGLAPSMCSRLGWSSVFVIFGVMGVAWAAVWNALAAASPAVDKRITKEERDHIQAYAVGSSGKGSAKKTPWRAILSKSSVWAIIVAHFCHNWCAAHQSCRMAAATALRLPHDDACRSLLAQGSLHLAHVDALLLQPSTRP